MKVFIVLIFCFTLTNCNSLKNKVSNLNKEYKVIKVQDTNVKDLLMTVNFNSNENALNGFAGCNTFFGKFSAEKNDVKFFDIGSTKKYCPLDGKSKIEKKFLNALSKTTSYKELEGNIILFFDEKDQEMVRLKL